MTNTDNQIIQEFENYALDGKFYFMIVTPIIIRLKEVGLIGDIEKPSEESLNLALIEVLDQSNMRKSTGELKPNGWIIYKQGIEHRAVKLRALLVAERVAVRKCFDKLIEDNKHIDIYLK
jgi:hypothetical protein